MVFLRYCVVLSFMLATHLPALGQTKTKKYDEQNNLVNWPAPFNPKESRFFVYNEIEIGAPPAVVWNILVDALKWHTFYKGVEEPVTFSDAALTTLRPDMTFSMKTMGIRFTPTIREFVPNQRLAWEINTPRLRAYHAWVIVPTATGCRLITPEAQNGFLTLLQKIFQPNKLLNLHALWLAEIKAKAEHTIR